MIKTFRGLLTDAAGGNQDRIRLSTLKGKVGYKIVKFEVIPNDPSNVAPEAIVQIWKVSQTTLDEKINFTDSDLLASAFYSGNTNAAYPQDVIIIFDNEIFNQDIYITNFDDNGTAVMNYYLALEVIPLDEAGAQYTTLKDMRSG